MTCSDRQLTEPQREAGFDQLRNAGVQKAIRPFSGPATPENLVDYLNREVYPVLREARKAVNEIFRQVTDQAPSGNPLFHIFSTNTAATDPGAGFIKLDNATQENATTIRISQSNAISRDITPWLDVMAGSSTAPLGVVTLFRGNDPSRYLRFDLSTMTDQGAYWDLAVSIVESSHDNPFVADDQVALSFIPGVASTGTTVPVGSLAPIAAETFLGNFTAAPAAPAARAGTLVAGGGLTYAAGGTLAVGAGTRITVNADDVQLAAGAADSFLGNFTAGSAVADYRAGGSVAGAGLTYASGGTLAVGAGTGLTVNANDVQLSTIAAESFFGNFTGVVAVPVARTGTSVAGGGLTYTAGGTLAVGAGTRITVNADDVQLAAGAAESFLGNFTAGSAVADYRAGSSVAGAGLTYTAGGTLAVGAGTGLTVNANDVQISAIAAESFFGNFTAGSAVPTARAGTLVAGVGLSYAAGGSISVNIPLTDGDKGDVTVSSSGTVFTVDADITKTWTGVHSFTGSSHTVNVSGDVNITSGDDTFFTFQRFLAQGVDGVLITSDGTGPGAGGITLEARATPATAPTGDGNITLGADGAIVLESNGDMEINGASGALLMSMATPATSVATGEVQLNADSNIRLITNGTERLEIEPDGAWQLGGASGDAGDAMIGGGSSAPPVWGLQTHATTLNSLTNSTANLTWSTLTIPANTLAVGMTFEFWGMVRYIRGATATASTLTTELRVNSVVTGVGFSSATQTINGSQGNVYYKGSFFCTATGAGGSIVLSMVGQSSITTTTAHGMSGGSVGVDTTAAITIDMRSRFGTAVASLTQEADAGYFRRVM